MARDLWLTSPCSSSSLIALSSHPPLLCIYHISYAPQLGCAIDLVVDIFSYSYIFHGTHTLCRWLTGCIYARHFALCPYPVTQLFIPWLWISARGTHTQTLAKFIFFPRFFCVFWMSHMPLPVVCNVSLQKTHGQLVGRTHRCQKGWLACAGAERANLAELALALALDVSILAWAGAN